MWKDGGRRLGVMWKDGGRDWVSCGRMEVGTGCHVEGWR